MVSSFRNALRGRGQYLGVAAVSRKCNKMPEDLNWFFRHLECFDEELKSGRFLQNIKTDKRHWQPFDFKRESELASSLIWMTRLKRICMEEGLCTNY
jgi:hypothetical protein